MESEKGIMFYLMATQKTSPYYLEALNYVNCSMSLTISYSLVSCLPHGLGLDYFLLGFCSPTASYM